MATKTDLEVVQLARIIRGCAAQETLARLDERHDHNAFYSALALRRLASKRDNDLDVYQDEECPATEREPSTQRCPTSAPVTERTIQVEVCA